MPMLLAGAFLMHAHFYRHHSQQRDNSLTQKSGFVMRDKVYNYMLLLNPKIILIFS